MLLKNLAAKFVEGFVQIEHPSPFPDVGGASLRQSGNPPARFLLRAPLSVLLRVSVQSVADQTSALLSGPHWNQGSFRKLDSCFKTRFSHRVRNWTPLLCPSSRWGMDFEFRDSGADPRGPRMWLFRWGSCWTLHPWIFHKIALQLFSTST